MSKKNNYRKSEECFACDSKGSLRYTIDGYDIFTCNTCTTGWLNPMPDPAELDAFYENYYSAYPSRSIHSDAFKKIRSYYSVANNRRAKTIVKHYKGNIAEARLLDIGSANGHFMYDISKKYGCTVDGLEISQAEVEEARELNEKSHFYTTDICNAEIPDNTYDVITAWDVLEHIPHQQDFLDAVHRILKPGGVFAFGTINMSGINYRLFKKNWGFFTPPEHVVFYRWGGLKLWLKKNGWNIACLQSLMAPQLALKGLKLTFTSDTERHGFNQPPSVWILWVKHILSSCVDFFTKKTSLGDIVEGYVVKK